eukprot:TRINITY_DN11338_c0_g1_i1.p1 TRINITY_DN11338_c0_g1~~TRINITY_DN11338_c0_g1_i1.p1  ORF type:complete len:380 (+),score=79.14 TRINITY_DN11338_c0_g1_i1:63-1202(+)
MNIRHGNRILIPGGKRMKAARNRSPWKGEDEERPLKRATWEKETDCVEEEEVVMTEVSPMPVVEEACCETQELPIQEYHSEDEEEVYAVSPKVETPFLCRRLSFTFLGDYTFGSPKGKQRKPPHPAKKVTVVAPEEDVDRKGFCFKSPAVWKKTAQKVVIHEKSPEQDVEEEKPTFKPVINRGPPRVSTGTIVVKQTLKSKAAQQRSKSAGAPVAPLTAPPVPVTAPPPVVEVPEEQPVQPPPPQQQLFHFKRNGGNYAKPAPVHPPAQPPAGTSTSFTKPDRGPLSPVNVNSLIPQCTAKDTNDSVLTNTTNVHNNSCNTFFLKKKQTMVFGGNGGLNMDRAREVQKARQEAAMRSRSRSHSARAPSKPPLVLPRWNF